MNCATHSDAAAVAFCRTCGKPLCNQCTRDVRGVIYCEACLAARMEGAPVQPPAAGFVPPAQTVYPPLGSYVAPLRPPVMTSGPNPAVAGMLAGFLPLGVGAVYCGQYVKGLVYLGIIVLTIIAQAQNIPGMAHAALGLFMAFFYVYQIIDAVRSAKAIQAGLPAPDPLGLVSMFGGSTGVPSTTPDGDVHQVSTAKIPTAAVVLIGLGVLFLFSTVFDFSIFRYWALILVFLGVYLFAKHWGLLGNYRPACVCERCRTQKLMGPSILVALGVIFLLDTISDISFWKTWPAILLVIGVVKLMQSNASWNGHVGPLPPGSAGYPPSVPPAQTPPPPQSTEPPASGEVKNV